jgi:hypothetical protein
MYGGEGIGEPINYIQAEEHPQEHDANIVDIPLPRI